MGMTAAALKGRSSRISDDSWIETALAMLAEGGLDAVRVEPLAARLGVTKGAFYARYANRDALLVELLDYWRRVSTVEVITSFAEIDESPAERLNRILNLPSRRPDVRERARIEMAIRLWAHLDERADATMREIDAYRIAYFEAVLRSNGYDDGEASARAFLIYSYVIAEGSLPGTRSDNDKAGITHLLTARP